MNLIEQLGGYENVSKHFNRIEYHAETKIFIGEWFGFYSMRDLKDALLEYRRQHNIFEVGDKVVSTLDGDEFWMHFVCTIDGFHNKMIITNGGGHTIHHYEFRHATDAEIEAGKRLEIVE